ncbi:mucin-13-like [Pungitius pungitius]|uniref:mucin-13-like n=1 Tax=Pungitius pungitius TaxID=134920 RepID=UPI002E132714
MAQEIKLVFVLWMVVACLGPVLTTTTALVGSTTTPKPATDSTTLKPPDSTTAPDGSSTTLKPVTDSTTTKPPDSTTTAPEASPTTPKPATVSTTIKPPGPCDGKPCLDGSTCQPRHDQTFECLCLAGDNYDYISKECQSGKVFPGQLNLPGLPYKPEMADKSSQEFQNAAKKINGEIHNIFKDDDSFSSSTVLEISPGPVPSKKSQVRSMSAKNKAIATVEIIFKKSADINGTQVLDKMSAASNCSGCLLDGAVFDPKPLCSLDPCDTNTTQCNGIDGGFTCTCSEDFIKTVLSDRLCIACPSGFKTEDSQKCVPCPFGRSGFNCKETWKLTLVIVGSVLGSLLLIALILLPVLTLKASKKISKKEKSGDLGPSFSHIPTKQSGVNGSSAPRQPALYGGPADRMSGSANAGGNRIPRATTTNSWEKRANLERTQSSRQPAPYNGPANRMLGSANAGVPQIPRATATNSWEKRANMEMTPTSSRQNLVPMGRNSRPYDDDNDMNPYAQARPQSNPYTQNQPRVDPYNQRHGHSNPYYMHDN